MIMIVNQNFSEVFPYICLNSSFYYKTALLCLHKIFLARRHFNATSSNAMLLLERKVLSDQSVNPINHALDQLDLAVAEPVLVGDVVSDSCLTTRLPSGTTRLHSQLF